MPEPLHLFDLPVDILALILSQLLTAPNNNNDGSSGVIPLCPCTASSAIINPVPVFLIHPSLYAIAHPLFYGPANTFLLDLTGDHASHIRRFIDDAAEDMMQDDDAHGNRQQQQQQAPRQEQLLLRRTGGRFLLLSQEARRRVRKLEMRIDRLRGWLWDDLGPFLQDMAVRGELADFTLLVDESSSSSSNNKKEQQHRAHSITSAFLREKRRVFDRPPLEGLVRLLADPGIREARLRVRGTRHQRAWCEFHPGRECGGGSLPFLKQHRRVGAGEAGDDAALQKKDVDDEEEVIDVDWRAILSKVDPEGRKRAVAWQV